MQNLTSSAKFTRLAADGTNYEMTASTGDTFYSTVVDMADFDSVTFQVAMGAVTGAGTCAITVQSGTDSTPSDPADLSGPTHTISGSAESSKVVLIEVKQPKERYLRLKFVRGGSANSVIDSVMAIQTEARVYPITQPASVHATVFSLSPAEA